MYLVVKSGPSAGAVFHLSHEGARIGRDDSCEVKIDDGLISKLHAEVFVDLLSGEFTVRDLGSKNGIRVNGEKVTEKPIHPEDEIRLGRTAIRCTNEAPSRSLAGAPRPLQALSDLARLTTEADPLDSLDALAARYREALLAKGAVIAVHEDGLIVPLMVVHATGREKASSRDTSVLSRSGFQSRQRKKDLANEPPPLPELMKQAAKTRRSILIEDATEREDLKGQPGVMEGRVRMVLVRPLLVDAVLHGVTMLYWTDTALDPASQARAEIGAHLIALALRRALS